MVVHTLGLIASALTTISFLPQAIYVVRTKDTNSLSLPMYIMFVSGVTLWLVYGIMLVNIPIILGNFVTGCLAIVILSYKIREVRQGKAAVQVEKIMSEED